jgi:hypothetical protein
MSQGTVKTIRFYTLFPKPSILFNGENLDKRTYDIFKYVFPEINYYRYDYDNKELWFEILTYDEFHMFATCARKEDIGANSFIRQRDLDTNKTFPLSLNSNEQLESYTFFYIDFLNNRMALISNKKLPKLYEYISSYVFNASNNGAIMDIFPDVIPDIKEEVKKYNSLRAFDATFPSTYFKNNNIPTMKQLLDKECEVEGVKMRFNISSSKYGLIDKLIELKNSKSVSNLEIIAKNDLGLDEAINLFECIYTRSVRIFLNESSEVNINNIKEELKKNLDLHLEVSR